MIPFSSSVKDLGLLIDQHLTWHPQVNDVSRKIFFKIHSLKRLQKFLPLQTKAHICQTLLLPILDYGDVCYLDLSEQLLDKLERLQNLCIRFIFGLRKYDHISEYRSRLKWVEIRDRRNLHLLTLLYNILNYPRFPTYLRSRFQYLAEHGRELRSKDENTLLIPQHRTVFYGESFTVRASRLWNQVDTYIRSAPSVSVFKNRLKSHYLT